MNASTHDHLTLQVPDISCAHCVSTIQDSLSAIEGVTKVQASVETKFVDVDIDPAKASTDKVVEVLAEAGYPARV